MLAFLYRTRELSISLIVKSEDSLRTTAVLAQPRRRKLIKIRNKEAAKCNVCNYNGHVIHFS